MSVLFYQVLFIASLVFTALYLLIWHKHYDDAITLVFALVPVVNLGYMLLAMATGEETALTATKIFYMGGCFLQLIITFAIFSLCKIPLNRWLRLLFLLLSTTVYLSVLTIGRTDWFYATTTFQHVNGAGTLTKTYGPLHTAFYVMLVTYFSMGMGAIAFSLIRKNQISRKILLLLFLPEAVCLAFYFIGRRLLPGLELMPAAFVFAQVVYLLIAWRINLYDVTDTVIDSMVESGDTGLITFDHRFHYLGSNDTARQILPGLSGLTVDFSLKRNPEMEQMLLPWLEQFRDAPDDRQANGHFYEKGDRIYLFTVGALTGRSALHGYRIVITDDTLDRAYINLLDGYNQDLKREVDRKTEHIVRMHDNLILSMAIMVESRDNSTGGHIRRTSDVVKLLTEVARGEALDLPGYDLNDDFCARLIKAAPMHDLGKIAVDDVILRKPGRFTPEEFEKMKAHAAEGARIVHEILKDTDDEAFHILAENVAHYHHERWDGSGYPCRLKGEQIPPEARIMAVADVYDALVSKRVYKEKMSFEKAHAIMIDGMGSQFDPALREVYLAAKPQLEAYYSRLEEAEAALGQS